MAFDGRSQSPSVFGDRDFFDECQDYATWANGERWVDEDRQLSERIGAWRTHGMVSSGHDYVPLAERLFDVLEDECGWQSIQIQEFGRVLCEYARLTQKERAKRYIKEQMSDFAHEGPFAKTEWEMEQKELEVRGWHSDIREVSLTTDNDFSAYFGWVERNGEERDSSESEEGEEEEDSNDQVEDGE